MLNQMVVLPTIFDESSYSLPRTYTILHSCQQRWQPLFPPQLLRHLLFVDIFTMVLLTSGRWHVLVDHYSPALGPKGARATGMWHQTKSQSRMRIWYSLLLICYLCINFILIFCWDIVDQQCSVCFRCTATWFTDTCTPIYFWGGFTNRGYCSVEYTQEKTTRGQHQMVNPEIRSIIFAAKDREALYNQQKQEQELTVAQIMNSLLPNSDLNRRNKGKPLDHSGMT